MWHHSDKHLFESYAESLNFINEIYERIPSHLDEVTYINQQFENFATYLTESNIFLQEFNMAHNKILMPSIKQMQLLQNIYNSLPQDHFVAINNMSSIVESLNSFLRSMDFTSYAASLPIKDTSPDDYITTDSSVIKTLDISDNFSITIGSNRIRIKTSDFIALIALIFSIFAYLFPRIEKDTSSEVPPSNEKVFLETQNQSEEDIISVSQEQNQLLQDENQLIQEKNQLLREENQLIQEKNQLLQEENQLIQEKNQFLQEENQLTQGEKQFLLDILESVNTSMSSQADFLEEMKTFLSEQTPTAQESIEPTQIPPDSNESLPDNAPKSAELSFSFREQHQEFDDSTQQKIDSSPKSLNTYSESE